MKKALGILLVFVMGVCLVSSAVPALADYKVAIVTNTVSQNEEEYRSAQQMVEKYGDRVVHVMWPDNFMAEQEQMVSVLAKLAYDVDVKAVVINQAVPGTNPAALDLTRRRGMEEVFETARMYTGEPPGVEDSGIFGVTSFELG